MNRFIAASVALLSAGVSMPALAQSSASAFTTGYRYDADRRMTGTIAPDPDGAGPLRFAAVRNTYDAAGRLIKVETGRLENWQQESVAPANWSGFTVHQVLDTSHDAMGKKLAERTSSGGVTYTLTQYAYDNVGRLECTAVRMNQAPAAFASPPASACALGPEGSDGRDRITRQTYDAAGQVLKEQRAYGTPLQQDYATYTWSPTGKRTSVTDANGNRAEMRYDGHDRQDRWTFPSKTTPGQVNAADYEGSGYDANGNRTSLRKRDGRTLTFGYDALNRMTSKIVPDGCAPIQQGGCTPGWATRDVYYRYDLRGLQTNARFDGHSGEGVMNNYTGFGEIASSVTSMGGVSRGLSYTYDANGNRSGLSTPRGSWTFDHDGLDRLSVLWEGARSAQMSQWTYNDKGQRSAVSERYGSSAGWSHDPIGRLSGYAHGFSGGSGNVATTLGFNAAGQITSRMRDNDAYAFTGLANASKSYAVNGLNQYGSVNGVALAYDANGNLTSDGSTSYTYDAENRLVAASNGATLTYDPLGRLFQTAGTAQGTTRFLYDGDQLAAEYDGSDTLVRAYVHGPGEDDPLLWYEGGDGARWFHTDHQGSVVAVAGSSGALLASNAYDEYGTPRAGNTGRFQYTGQAWLPELGLYHYKARAYSPALGRFLQTDPIGYDDQINLYAYVGNDPVNGRDPDGKQHMLLFGNAEVSKTATYDSDDPNAGPEAAAKMNAGILATVAATTGLRRVVGVVAAPVRSAWFRFTASSAYRTALSNGENAGHLRSLMSTTIAGVQRSLSKNIATIAEHKAKIANPTRFMERGNPSNPADVKSAVNAWQRTINRAEKQADIARDVLRRRAIDE